MTDFFENLNDNIKENAGLAGVAGGMAALRGQEAAQKARESQRQKLADIEAQLQRAENRTEKEAQLKRKLVALEELFEDVEERLKDQKNHFSIVEYNNFNSAYYLGQTEKASEQLSSIEDIKYAKIIEKKAAILDSVLYPCCELFKTFKRVGAADSFSEIFYEKLENKLQSNVIDFALKNSEHNTFSSIIEKWPRADLLELVEQTASEKGISLEPYINLTNISQVFSSYVFGQKEHVFITALQNKKGVGIFNTRPYLLFEPALKRKNALNQKGVFAKEYQMLNTKFASYEKLIEALEKSTYFNYFSSQAKEHAKREKLKEEKQKSNSLIIQTIILAIIILAIIIVNSS
jgi:hypothetical protein